MTNRFAFIAIALVSAGGMPICTAAAQQASTPPRGMHLKQRPVAAKPILSPSAPRTVLTDEKAMQAHEAMIAKMRSGAPAASLTSKGNRPGTLGAGQMQAALIQSNVAVKSRLNKGGVMLSQVVKAPGIHRLNGATRGQFEPGGNYEITGLGFGAARGSVFLRHQGRTLQLAVAHWSDTVIYADLPADLSGLPDAGNVQLHVGPNGKAPYQSEKFGFRAARADVLLPITDAMYRYDPNETTVGSLRVALAAAPRSKSYQNGYYAVSRFIQDDDQKRCINPWFDQIRWNVPLKPGFEVTRYEFRHDPARDWEDGGDSVRMRGQYSARWDGDMLRIDYAVARSYTQPYVLLPSSGSCSSRYEVQFIVTGPRGMSPQ